MPTLNRVQLIGRLGKDPETRFTPTGKKVTQFSLAVSNRWKDKSGEAKESTEWVNIEAWGRLGEVCQEYLKKGSLIYLEGRLKTDKYEARARPATSPRLWLNPSNSSTSGPQKNPCWLWMKTRANMK